MGIDHLHTPEARAKARAAIRALMAARLRRRFLDKTGPMTSMGCIPWVGAKCAAGYGLLTIEGKIVRASHVSLELIGLRRPDGLFALHSCDNPGCVNADHLRWGTKAQNNADATARNRWRPKSKFGLDNPTAVLKPETFAKIIELRRKGFSQKAIGQKLGVSQATVSRALSGKTYAGAPA